VERYREMIFDAAETLLRIFWLQLEVSIKILRRQNNMEIQGMYFGML
jgi:hypothetical protein